MTDLVKRLRDRETRTEFDDWGIMSEAADRIEALEASLSTMTEDRDKWAAESAENLRSLAIMTANAEALANELLIHEEYRWMSSWANGPFKSSPALAAHAKLMGRK